MLDRQQLFSGVTAVAADAAPDRAVLQDYLRRHVAGFGGELAIYKFNGGQSNPTYLLEAGGRHYVMRTKPAGALVHGGHAVDREYRVMTALAATPVPVAGTFCLCRDEAVIGTWFYVMDYVAGRLLWNPALPAAQPAQRAAIYQSMNRVIAALHAVDYRAVGLADFGRPEGYLGRQIERWSKQYVEASLQPLPAMLEVTGWLRANLPAHSDSALIHGDYKLENVILGADSDTIAAVLDWELSTLGDPLADFSYHCMPWHLPPELFNGLRGLDLPALGIPGEQEYIETYCRHTGRAGIPHWNFYMAFNLFRRAAIIEGVVQRARQGNASSTAAHALAALIEPLAQRARELAAA